MFFIVYDRRHRLLSGFTLVELLIVIVVIAILAAITTVGYGSVAKHAAQSVLQTTARDIARAMEMQKVDLGGYPTTIPTTITVSDGTGIGLTQVSDTTNTFCINITTTKYNDVFYSIDQTQKISQSLCPGSVVATMGDYNTNAGSTTPDSWVAGLTSGQSVAPGDMAFTAKTNDTWSQLTLSWNSMPGATQYRINVQVSPTDTWYTYASNGYVYTTYPWDTNSGNGNISTSTTSVVWTYGIPTALDQTYGYRIQYKKSDGTWSDWQQLSLSPATGHTIPTIRHFVVTPNATWSTLTLSWDSIGNFAKLPNVKFRINVRTSPTGDWSTCYTNGYVYTCNYAWDGASGSGTIAPTATSLTWGYGIPPDASSVYQYRIQVYSGTAAGAWTTFSLDPLAGTTLPTVSNFTVTPAANWSSITLSWDGIGSAFSNMPAVKFRINVRTSPTGDWSTCYTNGYVYTCNYAWDGASGSGTIAPTATSLTWGYGIPPAGNTYDYRIQPYSGTATGNWATSSLSR